MIAHEKIAMLVTEKLLVITIFFAIVALIPFCWKKWRLYRKVSKFPGPPGVPIFGNSFHFMGEPNKLLDKVIELSNTYASAFRVWLGSFAVFIVYDPDQLNTILFSSKTIEKMDVYRLAHPWIGNGLLTAPAALWKKHRKIIMPTFHQKILESFVDVFAKQSAIMTEQMTRELAGNEFEIFDYLSLCTLDITCETSMGIPMNTQTQGNVAFAAAEKKLLQLVMMRVSNILFHVDWIFKFSKMAKVQKECVKELHYVADEVLRKKKLSQLNFPNRSERQNSQKKSTERKAFLDLLMELSMDKTKLTDEELRDEVNTMIVAGSDTTALVSSFVLLMLALHPDIQEKVYRELCAIYGDEVSTGRPAKNEDLSQMEYLERVIKETMRLFPVGPILARKVTEDIDIGDCTLPEGSSIVLAILRLHRWEKYWPEPMKFDPDRFLPEETQKRHPYCYIPFSAGPRNCVGIKYAYMSMKVLLSTMLRRYVVKKDTLMKIEDIQLETRGVLHSTVPITIRIEKRR